MKVWCQKVPFLVLNGSHFENNSPGDNYEIQTLGKLLRKCLIA